jgi:hypothetical protein
MNVVLLRVGIDTGSGGIHGPLFKNGSFEFVPIPDPLGHDSRTYGNTIGRYGRPLIDYFPTALRARMTAQPMHVDPEFETFTYGDPTVPKRSLARLQPGDLLVFYAGLQAWDWHDPDPPALYIVGFFEVSNAGFASSFSEQQITDLLASNAHVRDPQRLADERQRLVLIKGGIGSRLLSRAVKISSVGKNSLGQDLKVLSPEMQLIFGDFDGKVSIQRSPPRWVDPGHVVAASSFVRSLV